MSLALLLKLKELTLLLLLLKLEEMDLMLLLLLVGEGLLELAWMRRWIDGHRDAPVR